MKPTIRRFIMVVVVAAAAFPARSAEVQADDSAAPAQKDFQGTLTEFDPVNRTVTAKGFWFWSTPTFNVGDACHVVLEDKPEASFQDLRAGHLIHVRYRTLGGVNVANQITQKNRTVTGQISAIDSERRIFTVKNGVSSKEFLAEPECRIVTTGNKAEKLSDLKLGHQVTVAYLDVGSTNLASKIQQTSLVFKGTLEAIDTDSRMIRAQHLMSEKKFTLADSCSIVMGERVNGKMSDLRPGDKLLVHYESLDGIMVANRIELPAQSTSEEGQLSHANQPSPGKP